MATKTVQTKKKKVLREPVSPAAQVAPESDTAALDTPPDNPQDAAPTTNELVANLPEEVLAFLVRSAPSREVWKWLTDDSRRDLLAKVTRGFQRTVSALRQPPVRNRLVHHLSADSEAFCELLHLWGEILPEPHVVTEVRALAEDDALIVQLPELWKQHGAESLLLALLLDNRRAALDALDRVADQSIAGELERDQSEAVAEGLEEPVPVPDQLEQALAEAAEWQKRAAAAQNALSIAEESHRQVQAVLNASREQQRRETHAHQIQLKHEQHRAESAEASLQETRRLYDRTLRRLKSSEKESGELLADSKRLKRQLHRQQQINEELRKQLTNATAKLQALEEASEAAKPVPVQPPVVSRPRAAVVPLSPLDQPFIWKSDGRPFRVTPREVQRAIDRNNEEFVFTLIQAFDALRETNEAGYRLFLSRIREFDRYYSRVLTMDTTRVLVDASNVARYENDRYGKGQLRHLLSMRAELRRRDCFPILIYADASLPYHIDEMQELLAMVKRGEVQLTTSGQEADEVLAREARRTGAYVVTNDRSFHTKVSPDFEPPRITFRIFDGVLVVDDF